jgi:hypothetical protein
LPEFSDQVETQLNDPDQCLDVVLRMNRELIDFYLANNFRLSSRQDFHCISQTVMHHYRCLNDAVMYIIDTENRLRRRRRPVKAFVSTCKHASQFKIFTDARILDVFERKAAEETLVRARPPSLVGKTAAQALRTPQPGCRLEQGP